MNLLFTVCGRAGSKGVKNKNIRLFLGRPLYYYTFAAIDLYQVRYGSNFEHIDVVINTDSEDFLAAVDTKFPGCYSVIRRDTSLGGDTVAKMDVIRNCLEICETDKKIRYDCVVDLDITSPLRCVEDIAAAVDKKLADSRCDVVFSVVEARRNPYFNMVQAGNGPYYSKVLQSSYTARQQAPAIYDMNASIYVYARAFLSDAQNKSPLDANADLIEMTDTGILDIDSENDYQLMQVIAEYLFRENPAMEEIAKKAHSYSI